MIIKEFHCLDCDAYFESSSPDPECPVCTSDESERAFLTAPSLKSPKTASTDKQLEGLARDYGLSDMSNKDGRAVKQGKGQAQFSSQEVLGKMNIPMDARDQFSEVAPMIQGRGPRTWNRVPDRK